MRTGRCLVTALSATSLVAACTLLILTPTTVAANDAEQIKQKLIATYRETRAYQAVVRFEQHTKNGQWTDIRRGNFHVALDRDGGRLAVDGPDWRMVADDGRIQLKVHSLTKVHLEASVQPDLDYRSFVEAAPLATQPVMPDVGLLLAADPMAAISGSASVRVRLADEAEKGPPALALTTEKGNILLRVDPGTSLLTSVIMERAVDQADPAGHAPQTLTYEFKIQKLNQDLDDDLFRFNANGSIAYRASTEFHAALQAVLGGRSPPPPLVGKRAPPVRLRDSDNEPFDLNEMNADVVILDFWATWCYPCKIGLGHLQKIYEWVQAGKKSVALYTINQAETLSGVQNFWKKNGFTMPVLMDSNLSVSRAYGATSIPMTVFISQGKVAQAFRGLPTEGDGFSMLKKQVDKLLDQAEAQKDNDGH